MPLPNLIIAGAQKSGTTWLHNMLRNHPAVFMSSPKELSFFNKPSNVNNSAAIEEYLSHFDEGGGKKVIGESTPHYFWVKREGNRFSPGGLHDTGRFILDTLCGANIIVILRSPVVRAVSAFHHHFAMNRINQNARILECEPRLGIVDMGFYRRHWMHWQALFGSKLSVLLYDDLVEDAEGFLQDVLRRLGLEPIDVKASLLDRRINRREAILERHRKGDDTFPAVSTKDITEMIDLYGDDIAFVEHRFGKALDRWRDLEAIALDAKIAL